MLPRGLIGVIHLPPMPGDPRYPGEGGFDGVTTFAARDAGGLVEGGVDGLIVENFGSAPYRKGTEGERLQPHQVAFMARFARELRRRFDLPLGVNCLRSDAISAIGIAAACGLDFVRVNVHTGAYLCDQGVIEGEAHETLRYRRELRADQVRILADVLVKHAVPLATIDASQAVTDCIDRGLADGVIVTGRATGRPVEKGLLEEIRAASGKHPIYIGSGLTPSCAEELVPLVDGAIVGTWFKKDGRIDAPVDVDRVRELRKVVAGRFRS